MVDSSLRLLAGWKYPLYYISTQSTNTDIRMVKKLIEEGVPEHLLSKVDLRKLSFLDFVAYADHLPAPRQIIIAIITNVERNEKTGQRLSHRKVPLKEIPFTKEEWLHRLGL